MRTISFSTSLSIRGRPGLRPSFEPSNLRATSLRLPSQDGGGQRGSRYLAEGLAAQAMANLAELRPLGIREPQAPLQMGLQDSVFSSQILIPQQHLLVDRSRDKGQDACPLHKCPPFAGRSAMGVIDRPKKRSGRHAARIRRDGITACLSCSINYGSSTARPDMPGAPHPALSRCRPLVPPGLDHRVEDFALGIHRAPEVDQATIDLEMPDGVGALTSVYAGPLRSLARNGSPSGARCHRTPRSHARAANPRRHGSSR